MLNSEFYCKLDTRTCNAGRESERRECLLNAHSEILPNTFAYVNAVKLRELTTSTF